MIISLINKTTFIIIMLTMIIQTFLCFAVQEKTSIITVGTTLPLKSEGRLIAEGMLACFNNINDSGGIAGKKITLLATDDGKNVFRGLSNIENMSKKTDLFANIFTSDIITNLPPYLIEKPILIFASEENGKQAQTPTAHYIINSKASIYQELQAIIGYAINVLKRHYFAIFYVNDDDGVNSVKDAKEILANYNLKPVAESYHARNTVEINDAVKTIARKQPDIVLCLSDRHATYHFLLQAMTAGLTQTIFLGTSYLLAIQKQVLEQRGYDFIATSVVPNPEGPLPIAQEYRSHMQKYYPEKPLNVISFDAYLNAAILAEFINNNINSYDAASLISYAEKLNNYQFKGLSLTFNPMTRSIYNKLWVVPGATKEWIPVLTSGVQ
jgi:branched-chain amino acid transport system substrate-binding protein